MKLKQILLSRTCLALILIAAFCVKSFAATKPYDKQDFLIGLAYASMVEKKNKVIKDHPEQERVMNITARLLDYVPSHYLFTVQIIEAPVANAFALPGGYLFITDKLLDLKLSDDELAFLLGHEMCHVLRHHHEKRNKDVAKVTLVNLLSMLGAIALASQSYRDAHRQRNQVGHLSNTTGPPELGRDNVEMPDAYAPILVGNIFSTLYLMHAFREHELDADYHGGKLAMAAGYSLEKGVGMFKKLFYSNFRNVKYEKWTTHPLTMERVDSLLQKLKHDKPGKMKSDFYIKEFRKNYANALLSTYNEVIVWDIPRLLRNHNIRVPKIKRLLLNRAFSMSDDEEVKRTVLSYEINHYIAKEVKQRSILKAEYGVYLQKLKELKKYGGLVNKEDEDKVKANAEFKLASHLKDINRATPSYVMLEHILRNYPEHNNSDDWRWQLWLREPDLNKKTNMMKKMSFKETERNKEFRAELEKMFDREKENPVYLKRLSAKLNKKIDNKRMKEVFKECKDLEILAKYQHEFPDDEFSEILLSRKDSLGEFFYKKGRSADVAGQKRKAVEYFHELLLYNRGSELEQQARQQIYKLNTLPQK